MVEQSEMDRPGAQKAKILIVDDEPFNRDLLAQELEDFDLDIFTAVNGQEALEMIGEDTPDLIFLDLMMPLIDGFTVLARLKAHPDWHIIPVVIISAADDMDNIVRGIELGADDFLPKPFEPAILQARLNAGLERKRLRDQEQLYLASLERELEIGREIQAGFLPQHIPQPDNWQIAAHFAAAREVAGDFYDVFTLPYTRRIGLMVGDVSDKGVGAALFMTLFRSLLRAAMSPGYLAGTASGKVLTDADYLQHSVRLTNNYIAEMHGDTGMFATLFFGLLDPHNGSLLYVNAGHEPGIMAGPQSGLAHLTATGPVLGVITNSDYPVSQTRVAPGELLLLYTDGVTDAENERHEFFSHKRLQAQFSPFPKSAGLLLEQISGRLAAHMGSQKQFDDITLLAVYRQPN